MLNKHLYHRFMLITKYIMFVVSVVYFVTLLWSFQDRDVTYLLLLVKVPAWIVAYGLLLSKVFGYCFAHRLPMYYMLSCNLLYIIRHYLPLTNHFYIIATCVIFVVYLVSIYISNRLCKC